MKPQDILVISSYLLLKNSLSFNTIYTTILKQKAKNVKSFYYTYLQFLLCNRIVLLKLQTILQKSDTHYLSE